MTSVGFLAGYIGYETGLINEVKIHLLKLIQAKNYLSGLKTRPDRLYIDIKLKDLQKLLEDNKQAIRAGLLITIDADDKFVPVDLTFNNKTVKAKARIKGNSRGNRSNRLPLRVKVYGKNTIMGMNVFSLHDPVVKNNMDEWIFQRILNYTGLISLRYEFIEVRINGKNDGIYAIEENFENRLIENNRRREGLIIRFDEYWTYRYHISHYFEDPIEENKKVYSYSPIDAYESARINEDSILRDQYRIAQSLLEGYRLNEIPMGKVFNVSSMAKLFALTDLLGQSHTLEVRNCRFYYNPVTSRIEPIGYDQHNGIQPLRLSHTIGEGKLFEYPEDKKDHLLWEDSFFRDTLFFCEYIKFLNEFSDPGFLEGYISSVEKDYQRSVKLIYRNNPGRKNPVFEIMRENQGYIRRLLNPLKGLEVYLHERRNDTLIVHIGSFHPLPLEVRSFTYKGQEILPTHYGTLLAAKPEFERMKFIEVRLPAIINLTDTICPDSLKLNYRLPGLDKVFQVNVHNTSNYEKDYVNSGILQMEPNLKESDIFRVSESDKNIFINPGQHNLRNSVIVPEGYTIICQPGTEINLLNYASIISYSPLHFIGSEEQPITIRSDDASGQGIIVMNAGGQSLLSHTIFKDLTNPSKQGWEVPGAITFYESPVSIQNCLFLHTRCEDALNIIRSEFQIYGCTFDSTLSDAFDSDFSKGVISDTRFLFSGKNAVDASGSYVDINNVSIIQAGDRGISIG